jgi:putative MFS transporter
MSGFNAFGALAAALIGALVVPYKWGPLAGWQVAFLIGAVPALFVWWVRRGIPESPRWLQARGRQQEALGVVEDVEGPGHAGTAKMSTGAKPSPMQKSPLLRILERDVIRSTLLSWVTWFCVSWVFFAILVWVPTLLVHVQGFSAIHSLQVNLLFNFMGVPGFLCVAYLVEHVGRKKVLVGFIALSAVSIFLWGHSATNTELLTLGSLTYFATAGMMTANVVYTAELFPTSARGTGVGAAAGWGRISAYFGIVSVAPLLAAINVSGLYTFYTILLIIPMVAIPIFGRESKGKQLEAISA